MTNITRLFLLIHVYAVSWDNQNNGEN